MQGSLPNRRACATPAGTRLPRSLPLAMLLASLVAVPAVAQVVPGSVYPARLSNTATLSYSGVTDPNTADNTAVDENALEIQADVSVTKTFLSAGPFKVGQEVGYRIEVSNDGPSYARDVTVTDTPTHLTIKTVTGDCTSLPCTIDSLAPNGTASIELVAVINATGAFSNSASAALPGTDTDPDPGNNTGNGGGGNATGPGASIAVSPAQVAEDGGTPLVFTVTLDEAPLVDTVINLTYGGQATAGTDYTGNSATVTILAGQTTGSVSLTPVADADAEGDETVVVAVAAGDTYELGGTPSATGTITDAGTAPDISVSKTLLTAGPFLVGEEVQYRIVVGNAGPGVANGIALVDTPTNLDITGVSGACASLPCTIDGLASGSSTTVDVSARIVAAGAFSNSAEASIPGVTDPNPGDNESDGGGGNASALPAATLAVAPASVTEDAGTALVYTVTLSEPAVKETVISLAYAGTATAGTDYTGQVATITIAAGGTSGQVSLTPVADTDVEGNETVIVSLQPGSRYTLGAVAEAQGVITDDDAGVADLSISKSDSATTYVPGGTATYTIVVSNAGPDAAAGVTATDNLPRGVTLDGAWTCTASAGSSCAAASGGNDGDTSVVVTVDLDATGSATITVPVKFSADPADY
jgi:uncharacterized repeat protein (TIGR01451 family)